MEQPEAKVGRHRREVLAASSVGAIAFLVGGATHWLTPAEAAQRGVPAQTLSTAALVTLSAFGEALVPGARTAGIAAYIDASLARTDGGSMLMIRYLDVLPPHRDFYETGLAALETYSQSRFGRAFAALTEDDAHALVGAIAKDNPPGWTGPPAPLFYFAVRADAVDIVYGTKAGMEALDIPYLAHIEPPSRY